MKKIEILFLNREDVASLLSYSSCIEEMKTAMASVSKDEAVQPIRTAMQMPDKNGVIGVMPGYVGSPKTLGIKVVSVFPENNGTDYASHQGLVTLYDTDNGAPYAIIDGGAITAIRTAASSALATQILARKNSKTLTIFGCGEQAETHLDAMMALDMFNTVRIWGRSFEKASTFIERHKHRHNVAFQAFDNPEKAVTSADVICTTTASSTPVLYGKWLEPGVHVNVVGSSIPTTTEIDIDAVVKSKFYTDYINSLKELGGDYRMAVAAGAIDETHIAGEIGHVILGTREGRTNSEEITLFKSLGMVAEDLISSQYVFEKAQDAGLGQRLYM